MILFICYLPRVYCLVELVRYLKENPNTPFEFNNLPQFVEKEAQAKEAIVMALNALVLSNLLSAVLGGAVAILSNVPGSSCGS